ncbi:hypothetical protein DEM26_19990 [Thioclava sp. NG1]|nr:hypothetical protein DEM26_19990 [Thioclava sp. NG1]
MRRSVFVVAQDDGLRRSIAFALEAEGLLVMSSGSLRTMREVSGAAEIGCAVIDEDAISSEENGWHLVMGFAVPIVLLADRLRTMSDTFSGTVLLKPLLGGRLVEAVARSLNPKVRPK